MLSFLMTIGNEEDRAFMAALYRKHQHFMLRIARKYTNNHADAEDVVSESCIALYRNIAALRALDDLCHCYYIASAVKRKALDLLGSAKRHQKYFVSLEVFGDVASSARIEKNFILQEEVVLVLQAVEQLPLKERIVLKLKYEFELDCADIAKYAKLSQASIYKYLSRAREKVRAAVCETKEEENHVQR